MIQKAFIFAYNVHLGQERKDGKPYISHPVSVAMELARNGADEELICAGLLHDTVEDAGVTIDELTEKFGKGVAELVSADSEDKALSWEERKQNTLDALKNGGDRRFCMLICADKLANLRDISERIENGEADVWLSFKRGRESQKRLFEQTVAALSPINDLVMYNELKTLTEKVFKEN